MNLISILGFLASSVAVIAFGSQLYQTLTTQTTTGLSLPRIIFDIFSLSLWILYSSLIKDIPLLIATTFGLIASIIVGIVVLKDRKLVKLFL